MGLSTNTYTYNGGDQTFPINFALGFITRTHVTVRINDAVDGGGDPVYSAFTWTDDSNIVVTPALTIGDTVTIDRTVPKGVLQVDFLAGADITPLNLNNGTLQPLMIYHELVDGRVEGTESPLFSADRAADEADAAEASAVLAAAEVVLAQDEVALAAVQVGLAAGQVALAASEADDAAASAVLAASTIGVGLSVWSAIVAETSLTGLHDFDIESLGIYTDLRIIIKAVVPENNLSLRATVSDDAGVTFETTGYLRHNVSTDQWLRALPLNDIDTGAATVVTLDLERLGTIISATSLDGRTSSAVPNAVRSIFDNGNDVDTVKVSLFAVGSVAKNFAAGSTITVYGR